MHIPWRTIVTTSRLCYENWDTNCLKNCVKNQETRDKVASPSLKMILYHDLPPVETLSLVIRKSIWTNGISQAFSFHWMFILPAATTSRQATTAATTSHFIPLKTWRGGRSLYPKPKVNQLYITTSINWRNKIRVFTLMKLCPKTLLYCDINWLVLGNKSPWVGNDQALIVLN